MSIEDEEKGSELFDGRPAPPCPGVTNMCIGFVMISFSVALVMYGVCGAVKFALYAVTQSCGLFPKLVNCSGTRGMKKPMMTNLLLLSSKRRTKSSQMNLEGIGRVGKRLEDWK